MKDTLEKDYMSVYAGPSRTLNSFFSKAYEWYRPQKELSELKGGNYYPITYILYNRICLSIRKDKISLDNSSQQPYLACTLNTG